eukprot:284817299_1
MAPASFEALCSFHFTILPRIYSIYNQRSGLSQIRVLLSFSRTGSSKMNTTLCLVSCKWKPTLLQTCSHPQCTMVDAVKFCQDTIAAKWNLYIDPDTLAAICAERGSGADVKSVTLDTDIRLGNLSKHRLFQETDKRILFHTRRCIVRKYENTSRQIGRKVLTGDVVFVQLSSIVDITRPSKTRDSESEPGQENSTGLNRDAGSRVLFLTLKDARYTFSAIEYSPCKSLRSDSVSSHNLAQCVPSSWDKASPQIRSCMHCKHTPLKSSSVTDTQWNFHLAPQCSAGWHRPASRSLADTTRGCTGTRDVSDGVVPSCRSLPPSIGEPAEIYSVRCCKLCSKRICAVSAAKATPRIFSTRFKPHTNPHCSPACYSRGPFEASKNEGETLDFRGSGSSATSTKGGRQKTRRGSSVSCSQETWCVDLFRYVLSIQYAYRTLYSPRFLLLRSRQLLTEDRGFQTILRYRPPVFGLLVMSTYLLIQREIPVRRILPRQLVTWEGERVRNTLGETGGTGVHTCPNEAARHEGDLGAAGVEPEAILNVILIVSISQEFLLTAFVLDQQNDFYPVFQPLQILATLAPSSKFRLHLHSLQLPQHSRCGTTCSQFGASHLLSPLYLRLRRLSANFLHCSSPPIWQRWPDECTTLPGTQLQRTEHA